MTAAGTALAFAALLFAQSPAKRVVPVDASARQTFERQPKVAVLAGVGRYPSRSGLSQLRYPDRDVDLLESELTAQGYKVVSLKDQEATRGSVMQALKDVAELVDRGSGTVLFFFSGHGFTDKGANYLATYEATSLDLAGTGMAVTAVQELLKATGAPRQVMFVDACRNEPGKGAGERGFDKFQAAAGMRVLFSTKMGKISYEDDQLRNGVFAHYLIEGLHGAAAGADGLITFQDLADYVTEAVSSYGFRKGQMQVPYEAGEHSGDFLLARGNPGSAPPPVPAVVRDPPRTESVPPGTNSTTSRVDPPAPVLGEGLYAILETSMGRITARLFENETPLTVGNFVALANGKKAAKDARGVMVKRPMYNGLTFHRVIPNFMIQTGDPTATGSGDCGFTIKDEIVSTLKFDRPGRLAMANIGSPNTGGCQFFITEVPYPSLNGGYTIFGQVVDGLDVVGKIARVPHNTQDKPNTAVNLISVTIKRVGASR